MNKPGIVVKDKSGQPIINKQGKVLTIPSLKDYPVGHEFGLERDGDVLKFKVLDHYYIGKEPISITVEEFY